MGIFDFFKRKHKKDTTDYAKWQEIVLGEPTDHKISKEQLIQYSKMYLDQRFRILQDCESLVNNTLTIDVYFSRLNLLIETLEEMSLLENFMPFDSRLPSDLLNEVFEKKNLSTKEFINRSFNDVLLKSKALATEKGRQNRLHKFFDTMNNHNQEMSQRNILYLENLKNTHCIKNNNDSSTPDLIDTTEDTSSKEYSLQHSKSYNTNIFDITEDVSANTYPDKVINNFKEIITDPNFDVNSIDKKLQELKQIKSTINYNVKLPNNNIEICSNGLNLSMELYNYCLDNGYLKDNFIRKLIEYECVDFKEELEHWTIFNLFQEAKILQDNGLIEDALSKYLYILNTYIPIGSIYYDEPFYLSIKVLDNKTSYIIYDILNNNFNKTNNRTLGTTLKNLNKTIDTLDSNENMYSDIKLKIISIIKNTPNIIQTDLYKNFDIKYKENIRFIVYNLEKSNAIKRDKKGRSYILHLTQELRQENMLHFKDNPFSKDTIESTVSNISLLKENRVIDNKTNNVDHIKFKNNFIPKEVFNLLWIADGKYKNYSPESDSNKKGFGHFSVSISTSWGTEPSAIYTSMEVLEPSSIEDIDRPSYYPRYENLSPNQKWIYLNWLTDISSPIDIGYVFIFFYGLQRHLEQGSFDEAYDMIIKLRNYHNSNASFNHYSSSILLKTAILKNRPDKLKNFMESKSFSKENIDTDSYFLCLYLYKLPLTAEDITYYSSKLGFTNKRYIKNEYDLFISNMKLILKELYDVEHFSLSKYPPKNISLTKEGIHCNTSLSSEIEIPDILSNQLLREELLGILTGTHELTKKVLRGARSKKNSSISKDTN